MNKIISFLIILKLIFLGNSAAFAATGGELMNLEMILSGPAFFSYFCYILLFCYD